MTKTYIVEFCSWMGNPIHYIVSADIQICDSKALEKELLEIINRQISRKQVTGFGDKCLTNIKQVQRNEVIAIFGHAD